ncbi:MAG: TrkH family potassium uptake protein [Clostridia bacterium]|nr:TrkH family potassium uptake protein [Clostridia bacterium]
MNRRMVLYTVGTAVKIEAALLLLPAACALIYKENSLKAILISAAICLAAGFALTLVSRPGNKVIYAREGFITVALAWIALSAFGALPFYISGEIPSYIDAFFETVSGFTTTGSSILTDIEAMSKGLLFWRSFTHWIGGMGVLVFIMAVIPSLSDRNMHLLRAEVPGPIVGKLVPRIRHTARILYIIYVVMTVIEIILLIIGRMPVFEAVVHAFGTAGTGGFGVKSDSIAGYSPYLQWVITVFMLLFGINFNLYYLLLIRRFKSVFKSSELWVYFGIVASSTAAITANIAASYESFSTAFRASAFQVVSIITTTGYATTDFDRWPVFSKMILLTLMFVGACAGSTGGGFKIARIIILAKTVKRELKKLLHPRSVSALKFEGKALSESTVSSVSSYLSIYVFLFFAVLVLLCFESFDLETNISAVAACFNNIGPGFGAVGPTLSFAEYSPFAKLLLSLAMLLGRLEIYPLFIALSPSTWTKK